MRRVLVILILFFGLSAFCDERTLFILDFSNSMNERLNGERKVDLMLSTMREILPTLSSDNFVGLRVYGYRGGFGAYDMCRASALMIPVSPASRYNIQTALEKLSPKGMTPITFSLKQAVKNDFAGFSGKKHIILLTDGGENCDESPCEYVMELVQTRNDVKIDIIAFTLDDKDALDQLRCASMVTRGKLYSANTKAELFQSLFEVLSSKKRVQGVILK